MKYFLHPEDASQIAVYRVEALACACAAYLKFDSFMLQRASVPHKRCFTIQAMRSYPCYAALGRITVMLLLTGVPQLGFCYSYFFGQEACNRPFPVSHLELGAKHSQTFCAPLG